MSTSAANMFNQRLLSTSSSENDVEEVFLKQGGTGVGVGSNVGIGKQNTSKSRCFSDPVFPSGKEPSRQLGKVSALSDSSNMLKKRVSNQNPGQSLKRSAESKTECPPIPEDQNSDEVFPEPETMMRRAKEAQSFSYLVEEEERENQLGGGGGVFPQRAAPDNGEILFDRTAGNDTIFPQDIFESTRNMSVLQQNMTMFPENAEGIMDDEIEVEEDDNYPEIERFPAGYGCCPYGYDDDYWPFDTSCQQRSAYRSCVDFCEEFPMLPDDLISATSVYPDKELDLSFVELPLSSKLSVQTEMRMKWLMEEN